MAALHVSRQAIAEAGWSAADLKDAALVVGTSRGNAAGWLAPWPGRRPFKLMAASNTIHSEPATAITIEFGIHGPNHVLASGLLESVILTRFLKDHHLPPNLSGCYAPSGFQLPEQPLEVHGPIYKLSHGMGGHNALLVLSPP